LQERTGIHYEKYENVLNWILKNRRNSYIPFIGGNIPLYVTNREELNVYYDFCEKKRLKHEERTKIEYEEAQMRKKVRKEEAIKNKEKNLISQLEKKNDRELFLLELKTKTQLEVLKTIIADNIHSIDYYPEELSTYTEGIIEHLSLEEKQLLINKLDTSHGSWKILKKKLKKSFNDEP